MINLHSNKQWAAFGKRLVELIEKDELFIHNFDFSVTHDGKMDIRFTFHISHDENLRELVKLVYD